MSVAKHVDNLLHAGRFEDCSKLLDSIDVAKLPVRIALSLVSITRLVPHEELPAKSSLLRRVRARLESEIGADRTERILGNA